MSCAGGSELTPANSSWREAVAVAVAVAVAMAMAAETRARTRPERRWHACVRAITKRVQNATMSDAIAGSR